MKSQGLLADVKRLKKMAQQLKEWEDRLCNWEAKLEDRERTLRTSYLEVKGLIHDHTEPKA